MSPSKLADSPLSLCYFSPGWPPDRFPNGVVSCVSDLHAHLRDAGHKVTILANELAEGNRDEHVYNLRQARNASSLVGRAAMGLWYRISASSANAYRTRRALVDSFLRARAEQGIELFEMEESFGWARWIMQATCVPVCVRLHGPWFLNARALGFPEDEAFHRRVAAEGRAISEADAVTAPSLDVLNRTRAYYRLELKEARVIPNPGPSIAPATRWRLEESDPNLVLFIGRFDRHKGGDLVIEAFRRVLREAPQARLWFVGPDRGFLDDQGRSWALEEFVRDRMPGAIESGTVALKGSQPFSVLNEYRRKSRVNVICSRYETSSRVLIETMSMGCPVVVARAGGMIEAFQDGIDALSHRSEDIVDLANKIVSLLNDPDRAAELGRQAAASGERKYHPRVIVNTLGEFYRDLIARAGTRKRDRRENPWSRIRTGG